MPDKNLKKNLLGREVTKTTSRTNNTDGTLTKRKTRVVFDKQGNVLKSKSKSSNYAPKEQVGKLTKYEKVKGSTTTTKKNFKKTAGLNASQPGSGVSSLKDKMRARAAAGTSASSSSSKGKGKGIGKALGRAVGGMALDALKKRLLTTNPSGLSPIFNR